MGILRTLFAISVVFSHSIGYISIGTRNNVGILVGGQNAVQLFYMISGFLISYVLVEKKTYTSIYSFYINRYLRLYPIYFVVALLSLFIIMLPIGIGVSVNFFRVYHESPSVANLLLVFSNATIFLQDWVMFSGVKNNELIFATNFWNSDIVLYQGLLIPQAWSLGVELIFYLIAPFVLARRKALLLLLVLSIGTRIYLIHVGLGGRDPWTYRFFPAELALFLLGALAHQLLFSYYKIVLPINRIETYAKISTYALIFITLVYWLIPINELIKSIVLIAVFLLFMPLAFIFQSKRNWDRWIGDLSYSIYICHMFVINISIFFLAKLGVFDKVVVCIVAVLLSIICSIILNIYIATPMELLRNHFRVNKPT